MKSATTLPGIKTNFNRAKVLFIEDDDDHWILIAEAMKHTLGEVTPLRVNGPEQALTLLQEWYDEARDAPKLIVQDLYLPQRQDGLRLLQQIKQLPEPYSRVPIVMLSSSSGSADVHKAYALGVASYMVKPVTFPQWLACFQQLRDYWWETTTLPTTQYVI